MRLEWWCQRIESNSPVIPYANLSPCHPIRDEYLAALTNQSKASQCIPGSSDWHERRGSLDLTLPTSQNELNSGPGSSSDGRKREVNFSPLLQVTFYPGLSQHLPLIAKIFKTFHISKPSKANSFSETFIYFNCDIKNAKMIFLWPSSETVPSFP